MKLIVVSAELGAQIDAATPWIGVTNHEPKNTVRYNMDKQVDIEAVIGDVAEYIVESEDIVQQDPDAEQAVKDYFNGQG